MGRTAKMSIRMYECHMVLAMFGKKLILQCKAEEFVSSYTLEK
jgi:hypothetical protein